MSKDISRRKFIQSLGRWTGLGLLGALVARSARHALGGNRQAVGQRVRALCQRCGVLPYCSLPVGIRTRKALDKEEFSVQEQTSRGSEGQGAIRLCEREGDKLLFS